MAVPWSEIVAHRERLLKLARRRVPSREDAEDVVQEAMIRSATFEDLDEARLAQFLTAVTIRLCADVYRSADRGARALRRLHGPDEVPGPEVAALAAAEAAELRALLDSLPDRQRDVLVDRAHGLSVTQISSRHALSYKATESALSRARATMRVALAAAMSTVAAGLAALRRRPKAAATLALPFAAVAFVTTVHWVPDLVTTPPSGTEAYVAGAPEAANAYGVRHAVSVSVPSHPVVERVAAVRAQVVAPQERPSRPAYGPGSERVVYVEHPVALIPPVAVTGDGEGPVEMVERCVTTDQVSVTIQDPRVPGPAVDIYCHPSKSAKEYQ